MTEAYIHNVAIMHDATLLSSYRFEWETERDLEILIDTIKETRNPQLTKAIRGKIIRNVKIQHGSARETSAQYLFDTHSPSFKIV